MKNIDGLFMRLAAIWFLAGVAFGIGMAASHDHGMFPVHAHINLLGWVSMSIFAAFYRAWPKAAAATLARWHFWLYVPAHFVMMVALALLYRGVSAIEPLAAVASIVVALGVVCFAVLVWQQTAPAAREQRAHIPEGAGVAGGGAPN
ncbi:hypothetical protein JJB11_01415 [Ramlibacter ginsenosidimutans]|uniref:Cytochrome-c oxidase n=1 Tax=Ramlibacter ginsenosidimutans TaxID=502333 RepID=A0A934TPC7_9BURK|nr:hypothetical protein [Ramlibacter ginsenosidimutans]MBK6004735.1 hypothetical protein [Ramlibacter ginsenosidimutans]